jgi:hypothetical protein
MNTAAPSGLQIVPDMPICQQDLPLDWYQHEFQPYAEEYLALPDRLPETVLPWMDRYVRPALATLGDSVVLLAHYYMGGAIVKLVERYGGRIADSYELALQTVEPTVRISSSPQCASWPSYRFRQPDPGRWIAIKSAAPWR